ncbi:MAG TPA: fumarate/nitrate reduction transcriptional regulator Fnr [Pseudomonadales bacterium]|jgi:CRP/FNR family transcriptional regulator|nr:fumarate/nitrate reduction transcriptional regulator Fnr [Pseudomonadales bacterium]HNF09014.1 fumarate/nitrate reduction transcriptional regulator Fnr [Pseudomonadales bacterium]HNH19904.1 fumarate/nitrate reduction transcriptional regulator Fnr [Pseudomonadales bacterium]HNH71619.1 fumarate/nitrate reduction transcriptional regulator Fnr [Pseudomonadales bacterium]HNI64701.1 fumarate/nitrate reduction transcriptional regulator Fnr [Pseudomonadales bacterium]
MSESRNLAAISCHHQPGKISRVACHECGLAPLCLPLSLTDEGVSKLDSIIQRSRPLQKGDYLFHQGDIFDSVFAIRTGSIKSYTITDSGQEQITGFYLPTELAGLSGLNCFTYPVSAVALETTSVCAIPYIRLEKLFDELPALRQQVMHSMSKELRDYQDMMLVMGQKSAEARIATLLVNLSMRFKRRGFSAHHFRLSMSRNEMGNYLGMAVETVSRVFTRFQKQGLLRVEGKDVEILQPAALSTMAGSSASTMQEQRASH